jgi:Arc/MetJ-type ribon-helix-helix transcriptional regulator
VSDLLPQLQPLPCLIGHDQAGHSRFNSSYRHPMTLPRDPGAPQAVRLPQELLERIDRYAARLEGELHLSVSRSDALRRLLTLALEDAEDTAEAEAILRANEPRVSWEELKASSETPAPVHGS